jgi:sulfur-oxidizing protein SoxY
MVRREFLQRGSGLLAALVAAGWLSPEAAAQEWNRAAFEAKSIREALEALGAKDATAGADIVITAPEIAENGAVVPVTVVSRVAGTESIALLADKNPNALSGVFTFPAGTLPEVHTRVKLAETSNVHVLVRAGGKFAFATKEIKVTLGGCGG